MLLHAAWTLGCDGAEAPAPDEPPGERPRAEAARDEMKPESGDRLPHEAPHTTPLESAPEPPPEPDEAKLEPAAFDVAEDAAEVREQRPDEGNRTASDLGPRKGRFELTYYWMARERERRGARKTRLYTSNCKPIARVSPAFASRLVLEGTGMLRDGRVVNVAGSCECPHSPCFFVVSEDTKRWGVGVSDRPLSPFRSVAVDPTRVSIGTKLYIPELDGLTMPGAPPWGGFVHDGCVIADDRGGSVAGKQLDFFMVRRPYYQAFHRRHRLIKVTVFDGGERCARERTDVLPVDRNSI